MPRRAEKFTHQDFCHALGKNPMVVRNLQKSLKLHMPKGRKPYTRSYLRFMEKVVALRALDVPLERVVELFETEKKVLEMLHIDSLGSSELWYLDSCFSHDEHADCRLLLTEFDVGFPVQGGDIQQHLNFRERAAELFDGREMGEDVRRVLEKYRKLLSWIKQRVAEEARVLRSALDWADVITRH